MHVWSFHLVSMHFKRKSREKRHWHHRLASKTTACKKRIDQGVGRRTSASWEHARSRCRLRFRGVLIAGCWQPLITSFYSYLSGYDLCTYVKPSSFFLQRLIERGWSATEAAGFWRWLGIRKPSSRGTVPWRWSGHGRSQSPACSVCLFWCSLLDHSGGHRRNGSRKLQ